MKPLKLNLKSLSLLILTLFLSTGIFAQTQKYFRTVKSGNYTDISVWQGSSDSMTWAAVTAVPNKTATSIEILHTISDSRTATAATVPNLIISANAKYTAPATLSVYGNLVNNGVITSFTASSTMKFINITEKTISGTSPIYFNNITIADLSSVTILSSQYVKRLVSFGSNALLNTGDNLILVSNITGTAGIGTLPDGADVTGKIHYERYIPGGSSHRNWRYMAMPVQNQTFANSWQQDIYITGPGLNGHDCSMPGGMIPNSAGFDQNQTGINHPTDTALTSTIFKWDEQANTWRGIPSASTAIDPTIGYRVFIRGDRNIEGCLLLTSQPDSVSPVTLHAFGEIIKGDVSQNLTYTSGKGEGWNLVSNPYACTLSWESLYGNNYTDDLSSTVSIMNPITGTYTYYDAATGVGTNGGSDQIGSGQSFFVQTGSNMTFNITELDKVYMTNSGLFGKKAPSVLKIRLTGPDMNDEAAIVQLSDAHYGFDNHDAMKLFNTPDNQQGQATAIASGTTQTNKQLAINFIPLTAKTDTIPLYTRMKGNTSYTFSFPDMSLGEFYQLLLHDKYTNTFTDIHTQNNVEVNTKSDAGSYAENRFELLIVNSTNTSAPSSSKANALLQNTQSAIAVYPIPVNDMLNVQLNNVSTGKASVSIYDLAGKEVLTTNFTLERTNETVSLSLNGIATGAYFVKAIINGQHLPAQKLIKN